MKKILLVAALLVLAGGPAFADGIFLNGGFDGINPPTDTTGAGTFANWTKNGGNWHGGAYNYTGDPGKSAIVGSGFDPYTNGNLSMVYDGSYAARVNNSDNNYHFSTLSQTVANYVDTNIFFAWAAVIQDPGHSGPGHVRVTLHDDTADLTGTVFLYNTYIDYYNHPAGVNFRDNVGGTWGYTDWNIANLDVSGLSGHTFTLTVLASDCSRGGHGGYAYFDGFGAAPPVGNDVPEPASMLLLGSGLVGLAARLRRRK